MGNVRPGKFVLSDCHNHHSSTFVLGHLEKEANVSNGLMDRSLEINMSF